MKNLGFRIGAAIAAVLAGVAVQRATGSWWLAPLPVLLVPLAILPATWWVVRTKIRERYADPPCFTLTEAAPAPLEGEAAAYGRELQELRYRPAGFLVNDHVPAAFSAIYIHEEHPIYALLTLQPGKGRPLLVLNLETFYEDGGRLTTTTDPYLARLLTSAGTGGPRLAQLRPAGRPLALDGQHVGTLKAWALGKRTALPAGGDALIGYIEADRARMREGINQPGWLPFPLYLRWLTSDPPGVLRF